ncbi:transcriptional regulator domain-containing protein [Bradyrhizobium sp. Arg314]
MSRSGWTDPAAYAHMRDYQAAEFAAEYLIRNDGFVAEADRLASAVVAPGELIGSPDFATQWGARFHCRRRRASVIQAHRLDRTGLASGSSRDKAGYFC